MDYLIVHRLWPPNAGVLVESADRAPLYVMKRRFSLLGKAYRMYDSQGSAVCDVRQSRCWPRSAWTIEAQGTSVGTFSMSAFGGRAAVQLPGLGRAECVFANSFRPRRNRAIVDGRQVAYVEPRKLSWWCNAEILQVTEAWDTPAAIAGLVLLFGVPWKRG